MKRLLAITALLALIAYARGEEMRPPPPMQPRSPYLEVLKNVPAELRGMWCIHAKSEAVPNEWTGNLTKEFALKPCESDVLPDVTIVEDYIHLRAAVRCHVEHVARLTGVLRVHALTITCQNRSLRNDYLVGDYPHPIFVRRASAGDLRIVADIEIKGGRFSDD